MYSIDKNVPIPSNTKGGISKYPWHIMMVGDSFFAPLSNFKRTDYRPSIPESLAYQGWRIKTMKVVEQGIVGIRTWRVA